MAKKRLSRREFLLASSAAGVGAVLAACAPEEVVKTVVVTSEPEREVVEQTVVVTGEPEIVEVTVPPEQKKTVRMYAQALTPRERLEADRWAPAQHLWVVEREYETLHPEIDIEFVPELPTGYEEWFVTQMSGGTAPEIVWYQRGYIQRDYQKGLITDGERYNQVIDTWTKAREQVWRSLMDELRNDERKEEPGYTNPIYMMVDSGARGSVQQIGQLAGMRGLMAKPSGRVIEAPIKANFREGLRGLEYFSSTMGRSSSTTSGSGSRSGET